MSPRSRFLAAWLIATALVLILFATRPEPGWLNGLLVGVPLAGVSVLGLWAMVAIFAAAMRDVRFEKLAAPLVILIFSIKVPLLLFVGNILRNQSMESAAGFAVAIPLVYSLAVGWAATKG